MNNQELRKLDAWIAERVMGYQCGFWAEFAASGPPATNGRIWMTLDKPVDAHGIPFCPTTDPAAALAVLEKCFKHNEDTTVEIYVGAGEGPEYKRYWCVGDGRVYGMSETLPLAICLFAKELFK